MKAVFSLIKIVLFVGVCVGGYMLFTHMQTDGKRVTELNRLRASYSSGQWQESIDGYEAFWAQYPKFNPVDRGNVGQAYIHLANETYAAGTSRKPRYDEAIEYYQSAQQYITLTAPDLVSLTEMHVGAGHLDEARQLVKTLSAMGDVTPQRVSMIKKRIARVAKKSER